MVDTSRLTARHMVGLVTRARCEHVYGGDMARFTFTYDGVQHSHVCRIEGYDVVFGGSYLDKRRSCAAQRILRALILHRDVDLEVLGVEVTGYLRVSVMCGGRDIGATMIRSGYVQPHERYTLPVN